MMSSLFVFLAAGFGASFNLSVASVSAPPEGQASSSTSATQSNAQRPFWAPPTEAQVDPSTRENPGFSSRGRSEVSDQAYRAPDRGAPPAPGQSQRQGYDILPETDFGGVGFSGPQVPEYHVVQQGDTLWGICELYFHDPYMWPQLWAFNEQVTNAHWIFPGDRLRLQASEDELASANEPLSFELRESERPRAPEGSSYVIHRFAYLEEEEVKTAMKVSGGADAKVMMSTRDTIYLSYDPSHPPIPGERLSVYRPKEDIRDLKYRGRHKQRIRRGPRIGHLVEVVGEVEVGRVAEKSAEARVVNSVRPIERGMRVGELKTRFNRVRPVEAETQLEGAIVKLARERSLGGEYQFAIVNLGEEDGVLSGNILSVVRKGDEYSPDHRLHNPYEEGHPRRVVGHLLILQVQEESSLAAVIDSERELMRGDHITLDMAEGSSE